MFIADFLPPEPDIRWQLATQMGVKHAIVKLNPELTGKNPPSDIDVLREAQKRFEDHGFKLHGFEGDQMNMERIKQDLPGRDEDLEQYQQMLRNMGELGIPLLCYNFMAQIGWFRTRTGIPDRGGALVSGFDVDDIKDEPLTEAGEISEEKMWDNYQYFLEAVLPVAEEANIKMGMHPDDPPVTPLRGIGRILTSPDNVRRAQALSDSPSHGVTFCQGCYTTMGADVRSLAREFAEHHKLFFIHWRDVTGTPERFQETFHDNGPTDMPAILRFYKELGFNGPIRVDHVPTMAGESNTDPGYGAQGRLFAIGYLKGILDTLEND
jgi:mannonate dehydratase